MDPASAAPVAGSAGIPAAPRTPASSPPSAGRSRTDVPPPAGSSPPHTPLAAPARTVPRLSSLRPLPILAEDLLLPDFCSGAAALPGRSMRDYLSGALMLPKVPNSVAHCLVVRLPWRGVFSAEPPSEVLTWLETSSYLFPLLLREDAPLLALRRKIFFSTDPKYDEVKFAAVSV